jgi:hypothetical protein
MKLHEWGTRRDAYGRVARVLLASPRAIGVTTGAAAPINSLMVWFETAQTFPAASIAIALFASVPELVKPNGPESTFPELSNSPMSWLLATHAFPRPSMAMLVEA